MTLFLFVGVNNIIWGTIGICRLLGEKIWKSTNVLKPNAALTPITINETAAILPAHNEEVTIEQSIKGLLAVLPQENIYVVNDNSTDRTSEVARSFGVHVYDLSPNVGKAKAIVKTCKHFNLFKKYKAILFNDADIVIDKHYLMYALPLLYNGDVACVAGHQEQRQRRSNFFENFFLLYRSRLWLIVQACMRYGQTWKYTNVSYIVPGALSIYKTSVLKKIHIDAPRLIIEDFNMTFELQKKRLGKIAYDPRIRGYHQDPYTMSDYIKQMRRWNLGFWQTVYKNGFWPSMFWLSTGEIVLQILLYSLFVLSLPVSFVILGVELLFVGQVATVPIISKLGVEALILLGFDYVSTIIAAIYLRKFSLLFFGTGFIVLLLIDAYMYLITLPLIFRSDANGIWVSPKRQAVR